MKPFKRKGEQIIAKLSEHEVTLISSLCQQLLGLIAQVPGYERGPAPAPGADDSFALWEAEIEAGEHAFLPDDAALQRLFPDAYGNDDAAAKEFRRSTMPWLREEKHDQLGAVLADLTATEAGRHPLTIAADHVDAWLKTLTNLRLAIAVRIGITDAASERALRRIGEDDPRAYPYAVYTWLNLTQESLIEAVTA